MAGKSATLTVKIVSDAKGAAQGFADAEDRVGRFQRGVDRASIGAVAALGGIVLAAREVYESASALEQSSGAVESVFGEHAAGVKAHAEAAADAFNLSTNSYNELAAVLGSQLQNMGYAGQQAVDVTNDLITVGADLAATFGGETSDAVAALSSLFRGERDPIEAYGVTITQAGIDARIAADGLDVSTEAAKRQSEAQATMAILLEQTASAQGAHNRELDTAASRSANAAAEFENAKASLGEVLLPIVSEAAEKFADFTEKLKEHKDIVIVVVSVVTALAVAVIAVNAALAVYRTTMVIATALQWAFNAALFANPLFWIGAIIVGIIALIIIFWDKLKPVRDILGEVGAAIGRAFGAALDFIQPVVDTIQWLWEKLSDVFGIIGDVGSFIGDLFGGPMVVGAAGGGGPAMMGAPAGAGGALRGAPMGTLSAGLSPSGGQGSGNVIITVNGALDPVAVGRQIEKILRESSRATGRQVSFVAGR